MGILKIMIFLTKLKANVKLVEKVKILEKVIGYYVRKYMKYKI